MIKECNFMKKNKETQTKAFSKNVELTNRSSEMQTDNSDSIGLSNLPSEYIAYLSFRSNLGIPIPVRQSPIDLPLRHKKMTSCLDTFLRYYNFWIPAI